MTAISKRTFLKFAAAGAAAVPASPLLAADAKAEPKTHWDTETDVLVIGYGGAGGAAAITAHDPGAKVLVIEKMKDGAAIPGRPAAASSFRRTRTRRTSISRRPSFSRITKWMGRS